MMIALHKNARTTPAIRAEIAASQDSARSLAQRYGVTEATIYKWKKRDTFVDRSHTAHRLQTTLTPAQEAVVVHLRRSLLLPLDDLLAVTREFLCPKASRSGLDRCLRRHSAGNLRHLMPASPKPQHKAFKAYEPGYVHIDVKYLPQLQDETRRRYLFVAIDRATRWVFVAIKKDKTAASARSFLKALAKACPFRISKVLTDNGKEFTDRLFASRERQPTGEHEFDQLCQELGIEHRLTKPRTPKTNGMVERFNGRISDVLKTHHFHSGEDLEQTLLRYVQLYNHHLPQSALQSKTPMQAMRGWYDSHPHLFHRRPYDRPGLDRYDISIACVILSAGRRCRSEGSPRVVINTIGPHWDGNQVWFITAGGAIFAAWPLVYATAFSGFYWAMLAVLWALFFRPVGFDYRSKIDDPTWRKTWDWGLFVGGAVPPLIFGVAFGNLLQGVPFQFDAQMVPSYSGSFWQLLNPFALLAGVVSSAMITMHGGAYLAHRTEGEVQARAIRGATGAAIVMVLAFIAAGLWLQSIAGYKITSPIDPGAAPDPLTKTVVREAGAWMANYARQPLLWLLPALGAGGALLTAVLLRARRTLCAFVTSSLALLGVIGTAGASMFPFVMPSSTMPAASLTVWDSVSSHLTLGIMFWATVIFMPLIVLYTGWAYHVMRGKVTAAYIRENEHGAY